MKNKEDYDYDRFRYELTRSDFKFSVLEKVLITFISSFILLVLLMFICAFLRCR